MPRRGHLDERFAEGCRLRLWRGRLPELACFKQKDFGILPIETRLVFTQVGAEASQLEAADRVLLGGYSQGL